MHFNLHVRTCNLKKSSPLHDSSFLTNSCQLTSKFDLIAGKSFELADVVDYMLDRFNEEFIENVLTSQYAMVKVCDCCGRYDWSSDTQDNGILKYMFY